jgi:energy-coupling factor transporter ATP-binding protein EcfA2
LPGQMLQSLEIENFRCFKKHTVPFRETTVIVGKNNAGKSTLIEALRLIGLAQSRYRKLNYVGPPAWLDGVSVGGAGFSPSIERFDLSPEGLFHQYADPPARITARFRNGTKLDVYIGPGLDLFAVAHRSKARPVYSRADASSAHIPEMAIMPPLSLPADRERVLTEQTTRQTLGSYLASSHFRNEILRLKDENYAEFKELAERTWQGLQLLEFKEGGSLEDRYLSLIVRDGPFVAELAWMGSGLKMWLQIMWFLAGARSKKVIVLDEPDIYMHPDLQRKLVYLTDSLRGQTILTTHSVELLSEVDPADILVIDKQRAKSEFASSVVAVQDALDKMGSGQSVQLMRLWTAKRFLIVEGNDVPLLSKFQAILFPNSPTPFGALPNQSIGGWGGWQRAMGAAETLRNSTGDRVTVYCVLDRDYQSEVTVAERLAEANDRGINLHVWSRKEIENYLLRPEPITRVIDEGIEEGKTRPSIDQVRASLDRIAEQLKTATVDTIAGYIHSSDKKAGVPSANKKARARVDNAWESLDSKLGIVSGKEALSKISKWSQEEFGISLNPGAIIRRFLPGEIDSELAKVVSAIELGQALN